MTDFKNLRFELIIQDKRI